MKTRFFCFPDMETSFSLAQAAGLTTVENGQPALVRCTHDYALDVIGVLHLPDGTALDGWHVNARIISGDPLPESFAGYEVFPSTPSRDFA